MTTDQVPAALGPVLRGGPYSLAIWDFDGVIADSEPLQFRAYAEILRRAGVVAAPQLLGSLAGGSEAEIWTVLRQRFGLARDIADLTEARVEVFLDLVERESLGTNWFVLPLLDQLRSRATPQLVISSGDASLIAKLLRRWGIGHFFDDVRASDAGRPSSKADRLASTIRDARGRVLVIEDNRGFLRLSRELGAVTLAIEHSLSGGAGEGCDFVLQV